MEKPDAFMEGCGPTAVQACPYGSVKTFYVFTDLPRHVEFRVQDMPVLEVGCVVEFDLMVRNPKDTGKTFPIIGAHVVKRRVLKHGGKAPGLVQFLEWEAVRPR